MNNILPDVDGQRYLGSNSLSFAGLWLNGELMDEVPSSGTTVSEIPIGAILPFGGTIANPGYLFCAGTQYLKTDYPELYAVIGDRYNLGTDTDTTKFRVPDLRGRIPVGVGTDGTLTSKGLGAKGGEENHILTIDELAAHSHSTTSGYGSMSVNTANAYCASGSARGSSDPLKNTGNNQPHNNMQPYLAVQYVIKASSIAIASSSDFSAAINSVNSKFDSKQNIVDYSQTETFTGCTFLDGSKIYCKTINTGALPDTAWKEISHNILNINQVITAKGWANGPQTNYRKQMALYSSATIICVGPTTIGIYSSQNYSTTYTSSYVTLYYTCTDR